MCMREVYGCCEMEQLRLLCTTTMACLGLLNHAISILKTHDTNVVSLMQLQALNASRPSFSLQPSMLFSTLDATANVGPIAHHYRVAAMRPSEDDKEGLERGHTLEKA